MALVRTQIIPLELSKSFSMACQASVDRQSDGPVIHTVSNRLCVFGPWTKMTKDFAVLYWSVLCYHSFNLCWDGC